MFNCKKLTFRGLGLLCLALTHFALFAQSRIGGRVINKLDNSPISGATIQEKGKDNATQSGQDGGFSLTVAPNATIVVTVIGFSAREIATNGLTNFEVSMEPVTENLGEIVVVGYGTQKRTNVTGAIGNVSGKTIAELPVPNISQALQGRVAGVQVTNNGSPGTQPIVRIRGISSISFASDPLYVVDGFPTGDLSTFDTRDIESVDVLKDASAAAIYGSRATNGVIMITTKKGKKDSRFSVSLDSYFGTQQVNKRLDLLNTNQYVQYATALTKGNLPPRLQSANFNQPIYNGASQTYAQTNTDWQDEYFRNGMITQHNIGMSGGGSHSRFYASAGYFKQEGTSPSVAY